MSYLKLMLFGHGVSSRAEFRRETFLSTAAILFVLITGCMTFIDLGATVVRQLAEARWAAAAQQSLFAVIIFALLYGALVYLFTRMGYYRRLGKHRRASASELDKFRRDTAPELTILVPSYCEESDTVTQTLLSAALQDYPNRRVVLLIDDPPEPRNLESQQLLKRTRALPGLIASLFEPARLKMQSALSAFEARMASSPIDLADELEHLADACAIAADWFTKQQAQYNRPDHVSRFVCNKVLAAHRERLLTTKQEVLEKSSAIRCGDNRLREELEPEHFRRQYRRLVTLFDVTISSFERKQYQNLSHEPNKAMNLNAYIGLMGGAYAETSDSNGTHLLPAQESQATLIIPDTDYLLTLDADSILLPDYAARLVHVAEQPGNERMAVVQTPYNAFPDAPGVLERIAGATTDIQYIIHQGFGASNAAFWVGANALLRKTALADIATSVSERGFEVPVFIQDRTVIEDTESTVDLIDRGWQIFNYPERLAYSATPPDFGSLIIQRRRWANGGLIILPKLLRYLWRNRHRGGIAGEAVQRVHYLASIATVNTGLLLIMAFPLTEGLPSAWLPLTVLPYFGLLARDLCISGYRLSDLLRFYALTLALIPVNLGGVCKSVQQLITGQKIPFGRTPKVGRRTVTPVLYVLFIWALILHWGWQAMADIEAARWFHALFVGFNAILMLYGYSVFIGMKDGLRDVWNGMTGQPGSADKQTLLKETADQVE